MEEIQYLNNATESELDYYRKLCQLQEDLIFAIRSNRGTSMITISKNIEELKKYSPKNYNLTLIEKHYSKLAELDNAIQNLQLLFRNLLE